MSDKRFIIIGAGPCGLGAGWELIKQGHTGFRVIEKLTYPGGLAASYTDPNGFTWDVGGETPWYLGAFFGLGAILGDAAKSFAKRQIGIAPGKSWFPFDQSDWIAGMLIAISPWVRLPAGNVISLFIIGITMHLLSKVIGKALHLNSTYI